MSKLRYATQANDAALDTFGGRVVSGWDTAEPEPISITGTDHNQIAA